MARLQLQTQVSCYLSDSEVCFFTILELYGGIDVKVTSEKLADKDNEMNNVIV